MDPSKIRPRIARSGQEKEKENLRLSWSAGRSWKILRGPRATGLVKLPAYMASGESTPRRKRPFLRTCPAALSRASLARVRLSSSPSTGNFA